jgi:hypothetical protein
MSKLEVIKSRGYTCVRKIDRKSNSHTGSLLCAEITTNTTIILVARWYCSASSFVNYRFKYESASKRSSNNGKNASTNYVSSVSSAPVYEVAAHF